MRRRLRFFEGPLNGFGCPFGLPLKPQSGGTSHMISLGGASKMLARGCGYLAGKWCDSNWVDSSKTSPQECLTSKPSSRQPKGRKAESPKCKNAETHFRSSADWIHQKQPGTCFFPLKFGNPAQKAESPACYLPLPLRSQVRSGPKGNCGKDELPRPERKSITLSCGAISRRTHAS